MMRDLLYPARPALLAFAMACCLATLHSGRSLADAHPGRYVVKPGVVFDTKTKLTWQQEIAPSPYAWEDAKTYCDTLPLNGLAWRLPSVKELETLVDESRVNPAIDRTAFPNTPAKFYWTISPVTNFSSNAWVVDFNRGGDLFFDVTSTQLARCVH
jgi:Protein of unknown function (DUF1566)